MQRYIFDIPETPDAKLLLKLIISSGYFNQVKKIKHEKIDMLNYDIKISEKEFLDDLKTSIQQAKNRETELITTLFDA